MIIKPIPTNVITGFLGVGKTSFIKYCLAEKPANEKWAVLVNEFGEIGIDAAFIDEQGLAIREVAGGCMCCAAGIPMQVALNQLIAKAKPDRLLIEPTGLGHPKEILKVLTEPHYHNVISLRATVCLVDARKIQDNRYREHDIFNQQLEVADILLATKSDLYSEQTLAGFNHYIESRLTPSSGGAKTIVSMSLNPSAPSLKPAECLRILNQVSTQATMDTSDQSANPASVLLQPPKDLFDIDIAMTANEYDERGIILKLNEGEGFYSSGWIFDPSYEFEFESLIELIRAIDVVRLKAVMITEEGISGFNLIDGELNVVELDDVMDSRIEIINLTPLASDIFEQKLLAISQRLDY